MDSIPGLVFYKDTENNYIRVNKYVADAHNMTKAQLEGTNCYDLYPRGTAQAYLDDDLEVIKSGKSKINIVEPWETEKGLSWVMTSKIPYVDEDGTVIGVIGVSMDITEHKEAEEEITRQNKVMSAISRIFREALVCETEEELAMRGLHVAEELTESGISFVGEVNREGNFDTVGISNASWDACRISGSKRAVMPKNVEICGIWGSVLKLGESKFINDPASHPDSIGIPKGHAPIKNFLGVPFMQGGKAVGMIALANKEEGYTQKDQEAIEAISAAVFETLVRKRMELRLKEQSALKATQYELLDLMRGNQETDVLCRNIITFISKHLKAQTGLMYLSQEDGTIKLESVYAHKRSEHLTSEYKPGEGLPGQAALEKQEIFITDVPEDYFKIESGLGSAVPRNIFIKPLVHNGKVKVVFEFGTLHEFDDLQRRLFDSVTENVAMAIESAQSRETQLRLLEESQRLTEKLQVQQEELKAANEELEVHTQELQESREKLKVQQEELEVTNEELEEKNDLLDRQKKAVELARKAIEEKAEELAIASKYKSEFLANMSHELRTPLNSLLLLAQGLKENKEGNLTTEQVEFARIIHDGGTDLLNLINEILDLSKIEAGRMDLQPRKVRVSDLADGVLASFQHMAQEKGLDFDVVVSEEAPNEIVSDRKRIEQIVKNLISNALKFTESGSVTVNFSRPVHGTDLSRSGLSTNECLAISVKDTGIGIAPEQKKIIFEAFQQADGGTARNYGGTGLGLSISRELARLLRGEIQLESETGKGSTFTLYLPLSVSASEGRRISAEDKATVSSKDDTKIRKAKPQKVAVHIEDDRSSLEKDDKGYPGHRGRL